MPFYIDEQPQDKVNRSREVCGGASASQACIFDYLATGDESLAKSSGDDAETSARDTATLGKFLLCFPKKTFSNVISVFQIRLHVKTFILTFFLFL